MPQAANGMKTTKTSILVVLEGSSKADQGKTARINGSWQTRTEMGGTRSRRCSAAVMWRHSRSGSKRNCRPEAPVPCHHVDHIGSGRSICLMGQAATRHSTEKVSRTSVLHNPNVPACLRSLPLCSPPRVFSLHVRQLFGSIGISTPCLPLRWPPISSSAHGSSAS